MVKLKLIHALAATLKFFGAYKVLWDRESNENKGPYLIRYYLFSSRWLKNIIPGWSYRVVLHNTKRSDPDGLHDHPWPWKSLLLHGGYWEETPDGRFWRSPEDGWRSRVGEDFHRLVLDENDDGETWSLFVMGPRYKEWGFLSKDGQWVQWQEYIDNRHLYF